MRTPTDRFRGPSGAPPVQRRAARLLLTSRQVHLRTLDAIHLALAIEADVSTLVTFDPRLREAAAAQGLFTAPA